MDKLGLIACEGGLPVEVARQCLDAGRPLYVARIKGLADPALAEFPGGDFGLGDLGKTIKGLKTAGCKAVCFAGNVKRPDFKSLSLDLRGMAVLPGLVLAGRKGDDAILRALLAIFEKEGFRIEGAQEAAGNLTLGPGALGAVEPREEDREDIERALHVAREIGRLDIGQGAVVVHGVVLAVEAQEGTDAMLRRVGDLPKAIRGEPGAPAGVLAKAPKPIQDRRIDLPVIGLATVHRAAAAGLAGIVGEAGGVMVVGRDEVIAEADSLGLFIIGVEGGG